MEDTIIKNNLRFKTVRLSNHLIVGNFSSPHSFTFEDGSVLDAVNDYDSERLKVNFNETIVESFKHKFGVEHYKTVSLDFTLSQEVIEEMDIWLKMWEHNDVDVVLCALPMIQALHKIDDGLGTIFDGPFRAVRLKDRIKKLASIDTFSI
jgi:hypothetical protein|tara:strand:+ start:1763 stop:2212 length:450 start_codon:yes stop_codon:yes gene_type:complete